MALFEPETVIHMRRVLRAPPATVFEALVRPELMRRWMCPEFVTLAHVEADARPGGRFRIEMRKPDGVIYPAAGTYLEVRAPEFLAFSWQWDAPHPMAGVATEIRITLTPQGEHTHLLMSHYGLPTDEERSGHHTGWSSALNQLERLYPARSTP